MKSLKKMMALVIAMVMVLGMTTMVAFADEATPATGTIKITTPSQTKADETVTYNIYKIFDASVNADTGAVTYKLKDGVTAVPEGFTADANGYITGAPDSLSDTTTAFKNYAGKGTAVDSPTATGPSAVATSKSLEPGYYYVETSTGAAVMVTPGGSVEIDDKNELSNLVKSAGTEYSADAKKAIDAVNTEQPFTIVVTKKHGATKLDVSDTMTGMKMKEAVTITASNGSTPVTTENTSAADATSFSIKFDEDYVKGLPDNATLTIQYTAIITSDALQTDPGKNTATLTTDNDHTVTDEVEVYNAKLTVDKVDENSSALAGAGFTLYKKNASTNEYEAVGTEITGVTTFEWKGLGVGDYKIEETTVPAGYTKADDITFSISDGDYTETNLIKEYTVENKQGSTLPSTGGIGTTIFYVIGAILVLGAGILLVTRRRMNAN